MKKSTQKKAKLSLKKETIQEMEAFHNPSSTDMHAGLCIDLPGVDIPSPNDQSCLGMCVPSSSCGCCGYTCSGSGGGE